VPVATKSTFCVRKTAWLVTCDVRPCRCPVGSLPIIIFFLFFSLFFRFSRNHISVSFLEPPITAGLVVSVQNLEWKGFLNWHWREEFLFLFFSPFINFFGNYISVSFFRTTRHYPFGCDDSKSRVKRGFEPTLMWGFEVVILKTGYEIFVRIKSWPQRYIFGCPVAMLCLNSLS
jgi:hypothetical protein